MDYHMQFMEFLTLLKKRDISYAISEFSLLSQKNVDNHMPFLKLFSLLTKRGLSYAIYGISFHSPKTWTIICNFGNFFLLFETWTIICNLWYLFPFYKNMDYHMQFLKFLSLLQKT